MTLNSAMNAANLKAALTLADAGFAVFPVKVFVTPNKPGKLQKRPLIKAWEAMAPVDRDKIAGWWSRWPNEIVVPGISLAHAGLILIDLDRHPGCADGIKAFAAIAAPHPRPRAPAVKTANGGGVHCYFRQPIDSEPLGNGKGALPEGIDIRGVGGFGVGPGSVTPWGSWTELPGRPSLIGSTTAIPVLPKWLEAIIRAPTAKPEQGPVWPGAYSSLSSLSSSGAWWLRGLTNTVAAAPVGTRNAALFWSACRAAEHLRAGRGSISEVTAALLEAATSCGLVHDDGQDAVLATIKSGLNR